MTEPTPTTKATPEEIQQGKTMAIVAYLIFFIPLLMDDMRKNKFVMFHTQQGIVLFLLNVAAFIMGMLTIIACGIGYLLYIPWLILLIIGIMNASNGEMKPLPVIGQWGEKFNLVK